MDVISRGVRDFDVGTGWVLAGDFVVFGWDRCFWLGSRGDFALNPH